MLPQNADIWNFASAPTQTIGMLEMALIMDLSYNS